MNRRRRRAEIGFGQPVKLSWLDLTVQHLLEGQTHTEIRDALLDFLSDKLAVNSTAKSGVRHKAVNILLKMWVKVPESQAAFRNEGLILFKNLPEESHVVVHWGMAMAIYPFFAIVAEHVGRLLRLQKTVAMAQIQKRVQEKMGQREGVATATQKLIRCWIDWGILKDTGKRGIYAAMPQQTINGNQLTSWLLEGALIAAKEASAPLDTLVNYTPTLFPFKLSSSYFTPNERLETFNQGVSEVGITFVRYQDGKE